MEFDNVILTRQNDSDLLVMFRSQISVSVSKNDFSLSFETSLPETFKG